MKKHGFVFFENIGLEIKPLNNENADIYDNGHRHRKRSTTDFKKLHLIKKIQNPLHNRNQVSDLYRSERSRQLTEIETGKENDGSQAPLTIELGD